MTKRIKFLSLFMAFIMLFASFSAPATSYAASSKPKQAYSAVKKAYGNSFPLKSDSKTKTISSKELGVSKSLYKTCYGKTRGTKTKYILYVAQATSTKNAKKIQSKLKTYVNTESQSMAMYLSEKGKKLFKNAKVGRKGKYVYLVMLDTSGNKKAISAIKDAVS
jgi:hypothetical protein